MDSIDKVIGNLLSPQPKFARRAIGCLAENIKAAIKFPDFYKIDYKKYVNDIIAQSSLLDEEKEKIIQRFLNPSDELVDLNDSKNKNKNEIGSNSNFHQNLLKFSEKTEIKTCIPNKNQTTSLKSQSEKFDLNNTTIKNFNNSFLKQQSEIISQIFNINPNCSKIHNLIQFLIKNKMSSYSKAMEILIKNPKNNLFDLKDVNNDINQIKLLQNSINFLKLDEFNQILNLFDIVFYEIKYPTENQSINDDDLEIIKQISKHQLYKSGKVQIYVVANKEIGNHFKNNNFINVVQINRSDKFNFNLCTALTKIFIPSTCTKIFDFAFKDCHKLIDILIPSNVKEIGLNSFLNCFSLKEIVIPSSVVKIGKNAFNGCCSLIEIIIPSSVVSLGENCFKDCKSLNKVLVPISVDDIGNNAFQNCISLNEITIKSSIPSLKEKILNGCDSIKNIIIPSGVDNIADYAFSCMKSLETITIPSSILSIGKNSFYECSSLTNIINESKSITRIEDKTFYKCKSLLTFNIPENVTSIGEYSFYECSSLREIIIPSKTESIGIGAFSNCSSLNKILIMSTVLTYFADHQFYGCNSLQELIIPSSINKIGQNSFQNCTSLRSISIPDSVNLIPNFGFDGCLGLSEVIIPSSVKKICYYSFANCTSLSKIYIPKSVTEINDKAFYGCSLKELHIHSYDNINVYNRNTYKIPLQDLSIVFEINPSESSVKFNDYENFNVSFPNAIGKLKEYVILESKEPQSLRIGYSAINCQALFDIYYPFKDKIINENNIKPILQYGFEYMGVDPKECKITFVLDFNDINNYQNMIKLITEYLSECKHEITIKHKKYDNLSVKKLAAFKEFQTSKGEKQFRKLAEAFNEDIQKMNIDSRYKKEMFEPRLDNFVDPSIYESPNYADYHPPIYCKNEEMMENQLKYTYSVPKDLEKYLGGARLILTYSKLVNEALRTKKLYNGNDYTIRCPIDLGFQRNIHPDSLYNLVKTKKIEIIELKRGSIYITAKNNTSSPVNVYFPRGSIVESPTNEQPCLVTTDWITTIQPGQTESVHLQWDCMARHLNSPSGDFRLTPYVAFIDDENYNQENYWNNVQPDISLNLQPTAMISDNDANDKFFIDDHNPFNEPSPSQDPFNELSPSRNPFNEPPPSQDPFNEPPPSQDPFNEPPPSQDPFNEPPPSQDPFNEPPPSQDPFNELNFDNDEFITITKPNTNDNSMIEPISDESECIKSNDDKTSKISSLENSCNDKYPKETLKRQEILQGGCFKKDSLSFMFAKRNAIVKEIVPVMRSLDIQNSIKPYIGSFSEIFPSKHTDPNDVIFLKHFAVILKSDEFTPVILEKMDDSFWHIKECTEDKIDGQFFDQDKVKYIKDFPSFSPIKGIKLNEITNAVFSDPEDYSWYKHNCYHSRKHIMQKLGYETPTYSNTLMNEVYVSPVINNTIEKAKKSMYKVLNDHF